ncbi:hypothetical protein EJ02DRAFT_513657 [Clathrospora elynae]|uniref:Uncharacterized protein n=1 Tax=Clathrospora elynae TaxID=706981 RepID=A0A6A5SGD2_9PLEO|nr:hypothetical protein EJ02DRAFT_513657 [Clathrospora elynae]
MIFRLSSLIAALTLVRHVAAEVAPEITTVTDGYNVIAKLPCIGCPFLYQDISKGYDDPWAERKDENALLLNISLPYDSAHLSINDAPLLTGSKNLPRIYVNQVLLETSKDELSQQITTNQLDNLGGSYFGASYAYSLYRVKNSSALVFHLDIMELWSDLPSPPITVVLDDKQQKMLELVLLERPLLSAGDPGSAYEIPRASLIPRSSSLMPQRKMWFRDWDKNGKKSTTTHLVNNVATSFISNLSSGVFSLFVFILAVMALFVVVCMFVIFSCGWHKDEYEQAQGKKKKSGSTKGSGNWSGNDIEMARKFRSPEELGLRGGGRVVGVGKSD